MRILYWVQIMTCLADRRYYLDYDGDSIVTVGSWQESNTDTYKDGLLSRYTPHMHKV